MTISRQLQVRRRAGDYRRQFGPGQIEMEDVLGAEIFSPAQARGKRSGIGRSGIRGERREGFRAKADGQGRARRQANRELQARPRSSIASFGPTEPGRRLMVGLPMNWATFTLMGLP